jgi:hypothetical protein
LFGETLKHEAIDDSDNLSRATEVAVTAHVKLLDRHSACILWIFFDPDTLALGPHAPTGCGAADAIFAADTVGFPIMGSAIVEGGGPLR